MSCEEFLAQISHWPPPFSCLTMETMKKPETSRCLQCQEERPPPVVQGYACLVALSTVSDIPLPARQIGDRPLGAPGPSRQLAVVGCHILESATRDARVEGMAANVNQVNNATTRLLAKWLYLKELCQEILVCLQAEFSQIAGDHYSRVGLVEASLSKARQTVDFRGVSLGSNSPRSASAGG